MHLVTTAQMQTLDKRTIEEAKVPGTRLMEQAGRGVVRAIEQRWGPWAGKTVLVYCGKGNNGGDGFVIARLLKKQQARVYVLLLTDAELLTHDAAIMYRRFIKQAGSSAVIARPSSTTIHRTAATHVDFHVDALLGTGISSPVKDRYRDAIEAMNLSSAPTVAVDIPSGIHSDTGAVMGVAVRAAMTITFGCPKVGLYVGQAIDHAGDIVTVDIGIPPSYVDDLPVHATLLQKSLVASKLPSRPRSAHKGTFGHAGIIAGSPGKTGAAIMAARAALRIGTGLVTVASPRSLVPILGSTIMEAMSEPMPETRYSRLGRSSLTSLIHFANQRTSTALGPGMGTHRETGALIRAFLPKLERSSVVDADGLNALEGHVSTTLRSCRTPHILTPHPGEMARLLGYSSGTSVNEDRLGLARHFSTTYNVVLVLKGARTVIASPNGQAAICPTGNPGMATAGMGDALTGTIVGLLAQGLNPWDAAICGVYLHGLAGDLAAEKIGEAGLMAGDVIECLPSALSHVSSP